MIKRVTFLIASIILIAVSVMLCTINSKVTITDTSYTADTLPQSLIPSPVTSALNENVVFDKLAIITADSLEGSDVDEEINTVDARDFEFGDYLPVVFFDTVSNAEGGYYREYAVLGYDTLEECAKAFNAVGDGKIQELSQLFAQSIDTSNQLDTKKTDIFYKYYASNSFYAESTDAPSIKELELSILEVAVSDKNYLIATNNPEKYRMQIEQVINGRYYLISIFHLNPDSYTKIKHNGVYLYDIENDKLTHLAHSAFNPTLSPDMKYLVYTSQAKKHKGMLDGWGQIKYHNTRGFYVKNLENGETAFYKYPNYGDFADYGCINWIKTEDFTPLVSEAVAVTLADTTRKFFENTRTLPEKGENLKTLTIPFPEDFPMDPYREPTLTSPEDFEFGEYMLRVSFPVGNITASDDVYANSFLGEGVNTIREGRFLFDRFNEKYLIKSPVNNFYYQHYLAPPNSFLGSYLFNSSVGRISPDGRQVTVNSFIDSTDDRNVAKYWYSYTDWTQKTDYYLDGKLVASELDANYFDYSAYTTVNSPQYETDYNTFTSDGDYIVNTSYFEDAYIFSKSQNKWVYRLALPNVYEETENGRLLVHKCSLEQIIADRYLLLDISKVYPDNRTFSHCTYLYDMDTGLYTYLGSYFYEPTISPDNRYLAYQSVWYDYMGNTTINNLVDMKNGFFILELETGKTVFYSAGSSGDISISGWVSKAAIDSTIAHEGSFISPDVEQREDIVLQKSGADTKRIVLEIDPRVTVSDSLTWVGTDDFKRGEYIPFIEKDNEYNFLSFTNGEDALASKLTKKLNVTDGSRLIYVSEGGDKFGIITENGEGGGIYRLTDANGTVVFEATITEERYMSLIEIYEGKGKQGYVPPVRDDYYSLEQVDGAIIYPMYGDSFDTVYIYNGKDPEPLYEVVLPTYINTDENGTQTISRSYIYSCSLNGYAIIRSETVPIDYYGSTTVNAYYFVDLNKKTVIPIDRNIHEMKISPDGKNAFGQIYGEEYISVYLDFESGSYLKYPYADIIGWVDAENIISFANN